MLTTSTTSITTNSITSITTTIILTISMMLTRPGLSFSLVTSYTDTMCGATFTDRCPHISKGGSICITRKGEGEGGGGEIFLI